MRALRDEACVQGVEPGFCGWDFHIPFSGKHIGHWHHSDQVTRREESELCGRMDIAVPVRRERIY